MTIGLTIEWFNEVNLAKNWYEKESKLAILPDLWT